MKKNNTKILFLIQARLGSRRLPNKVIRTLYENRALVELVYERITLSNYSNSNNIYVLTSDNKQDDLLVDYLKKKQINFFRGNEENVYLRYYDFLEQNSNINDVNYFVRVCCDNPFIEPVFIDNLIDSIEDDVDYISYYDTKNHKSAILTHLGLFVELINVQTFIKSRKLVDTKIYKEHVTPLFYNDNHFNLKYINIPEELLNNNYRFTIDTEIDFENAKIILHKLGKNDFNYKDLISVISDDDEIQKNMITQIALNSK